MSNPITKTSGPCVILAGAGTGKTHTIVEKLKYLIGNKICPPQKIICITFSNEAANNLLMRVQKAFKQDLEKLPLVRTFHGLCADLLREHALVLEMKSDFQILTPDESKIMIHRSLHVAAVYCHKYVSTISTAKDLGITPAILKVYLDKNLQGKDASSLQKRYGELQFDLQTIHLKGDKETSRIPEAGSGFSSASGIKIPDMLKNQDKGRVLDRKQAVTKELDKLHSLLELKKFITVWESYEKIKKKQNYQDYADLHLNALSLLEKRPEIAEAFSFIVVDEFQDTNKIQLELLKLLSPLRNITVVGDANQSIYRFRGAYKDNLSLFRTYFGISEKDIHTLTASFRSPDKVLRNAHTLILNNYENKEECFKVENAYKKEGKSIEVYELKNAREEARKVVELIQRELSLGNAYEEICVMFRTHQQGVSIKRALEQGNIPYTAVSKSSLLRHPAVKTTIDYLTIINCVHKNIPGAEQAWWDLAYQLDFADDDLVIIGRSIKEKEAKGPLSTQLLESLEKLNLSAGGKVAARMLVERIRILSGSAKKPVNELLLEIFPLVGLVSDDSAAEGRSMVLHLHKLLELALNHSSSYGPDLGIFLNYLDIVNKLGIDMDAPLEQGRGVQLMTLHATKGLEYKTVILTNMAQKRFPLERISSNILLPSDVLPELGHITDLPAHERDAALEAYERHHLLLDERRLCYVAFTRARENLFITYALEYGGKKHAPSTFLHEISHVKNPDIAFSKDHEEKAAIEEIEFKSAAKLSTMLSAQKFEDALLSALKSQERLPHKPSMGNRAFSPSSLLAFAECEKAYEYRYVYNMPERKSISWDALRLGSFVHMVLEEGVNEGFKTIKEFTDKSMELHLLEEWAAVNLDEALPLIAVFFERNKNKYNEKSKTELELRAMIGGFAFTGYADRIDYHPEGIEIIDYKTGKSAVPPLHRNWQLGFYAIAARSLGQVKKITLDMLKQEKPLEFEIDEKGNATACYGNMSFNIYEIEHELIQAASAITKAYESGFKACPLEKNCEFCNEYVYGN